MIYRGRTAIVTGASAGIGLALARALASRGADVALVARRADRLEALAHELSEAHGVKAFAVPADLAAPDAPADVFKAVEAEGSPVGIVVNNAGFGLPGHFEENDWRAHRAFIELMTTSCAHFAHLALPGMQARGWGRIINVAAVAGLVPGGAGHTLYGATKAFLVSFSQSLAAENAGRGVNVTALCPGFTYSEFHDVNGTRTLVSRLPRFMFMDAAPVAEAAIGAVERGHVVCVPGAWNKAVVGFTDMLPRPVAAGLVTGQARKFRKRNA